MGRLSKYVSGGSLEEIRQQRQAEKISKEQELQNQWDNFTEFSAAYELNNSNGDAESPAASTSKLTKKERNALRQRNAGENSKGVRYSEVQKEASKFVGEKVSRKRRYDRTSNGSSGDLSINGAEILGPKKRRYATIESSDDDSDAELSVRSPKKSKQLNGDNGALVPVANFEETEEVEEQESTSYYVTTPSDEENNANGNDSDDEDENLGIPTLSSFICTFGNDDDYEDESEESFGIDLDETDGEEAEDALGESDLDFIDDASIEDEAEDDEEVEEDNIIYETRRKPKQSYKVKENLDSDEDDDDYAEDEESENESIEAIDPEELNELLEDSTGTPEESNEDLMTHIDPDGLKLQPMGLTVVGFDVDESVQSFVKLERDVSSGEYDPVRFKLFGFTDDNEHSLHTAARAMRYLISPLGVQPFFEHIYAKRGLVIKRSDPRYFGGIFPIESFYKMFQEHYVEFGVNVNVASYDNGVRSTHNPDGRAYALQIRALIAEGMSIQCVNPQTFNKNIHYLCDVLQEFFNCFVGANCYYTPKGSSGFAPHWDDIDAFLIQTAGKKHWKIYAPIEAEEMWPLESSGNLSAEEMEEREDQLVFDGWMETGDVLYLPRGFIHCAHTDDKHDSLHVTISAAQKHSYVQLTEKIMQKLLNQKSSAIAQMRKNLPINVGDICGVGDIQYENEENFEKSLVKPISAFVGQFKANVENSIPAAVDEISRDFIRKALPPLLTEFEKAHSVFGTATGIPEIPDLNERSEVRIIRKHTQRLLFESEDKAFLVHRMANSMVYEGRPEVTLDVPTELVSAVERLLLVYPEWESVENLDPELDVGIETVHLLFAAGLLLIRQRPAKKKKKNAEKVQKKKKSKANKSEMEGKKKLKRSKRAPEKDETLQNMSKAVKKHLKMKLNAMAAAMEAEAANVKTVKKSKKKKLLKKSKN